MKMRMEPFISTARRKIVRALGLTGSIPNCTFDGEDVAKDLMHGRGGDLQAGISSSALNLTKPQSLEA